LLGITLFWACQKDKLPKPTQEGKNTFGCKINGKPWIPNGGPGFQGAKPIEGGFVQIILSSDSTKTGIFLRAYAKDGSMLHLYLNDHQSSTYILNRETNIKPFSLRPLDYAAYYSNGNYYITNSQSTGKIVITRSGFNVDGILSGIFEFRVINKNR
jgi:hypothetical protein